MKITKALALILALLLCTAAVIGCEMAGDGSETKAPPAPGPGAESANNSTGTEDESSGTNEKEEVERFDYFGATLSDYVTVDKALYQNTKVTLSSDYVVDDKVVKTYIDSLLFKYREKTNGDTKINESPIKYGDSAFIYYKGLKDGKEFEGGSNFDDKAPYELGIGSGSFIPGFEDGLIGVIPSETSKEKPFELNVTFPENYQSADLAGQAVVFRVYVEYIVQYTLPEYNADFITNTLKYEAKTEDVVAEYNEYAKQLLEEDASAYAKNAALNILWEELLDKVAVKKYPEGEVDYYYNSYIEQYEYYMKMFNTYYGYNFKSLDEFVIEYEGLEEGTDWKANTRNNAEIDTTQNMIFHAIAQQEGILVTDVDYQNSIQYYIDYYKANYNQTYTAKEIEEGIGERMLKENALFEKINKYLFDNCTVTYEDKE